MPHPHDEVVQLAHEYGVLLKHCGALQTRCSEQQRHMMQEIDRLQGMVIRLRADLVIQKSLMHWEREKHRRARKAAEARQHGVESASVPPSEPEGPADAAQQCLERSLHAADLVICQTGCISAGSFWRVEDHCKRTGKTCVLVDQPEALRIVRVHPSGRTEALATAPINTSEITS